jgi:hypothetical protein
MHCFDVEHWRVLRQVEAFFKKNADFSNESDCMNAARSSFERGERICRITNKRLDYYYSRPDRIPEEISVVIARAQQFITDVLGDFSDFSDAIPDLIRITSGATARSSRSKSLPFQKLGRNPACSPRCIPLLRSLYRYHGYKPPRCESTAWNRVTFVPKNWKTHRTIACEPAGNVPVQLAFDGWAKRGLSRFGYDLSNQSENQRLAKLGSEDGSLATIDLSMASDTLSYNTVAWLLPDDWFKYLSIVRSPLFKIGDEKVRKYAKFSSMGNGATFALETLIFASFVNAISSNPLAKSAVYGDDLIVPTEDASMLMRVLKFFGFVPNESKSFLKGPFRESCGHDYYQGRNITPFYLRRAPAWDKPYACHNVNGLARIAPHGKLWDYLGRLSADMRLPLVPVSYDTLSGIFIHPYFAYKRKKTIRLSRKGVLESKQYFSKGSKVSCQDSRALALWFVGASQKDDSVRNHRGASRLRGRALAHFLDRYEASLVCSSRYTTSIDGKFVMKWAPWVYNPGLGLSENIFSFSELLHRLYTKV